MTLAVIPYGLETLFITLMGIGALAGAFCVIALVFDYPINWRSPSDVIVFVTLVLGSIALAVGFWFLLQFQLDRDVVNNHQLGKDAKATLSAAINREQKAYDDTGRYVPLPTQKFDSFYISDNLQVVDIEKEAHSDSQTHFATFKALLAKGTTLTICTGKNSDTDGVGCPDNGKWTPQDVKPQPTHPTG